MTTQFTSSIFGLLKRGREAVARGQLSGTGFALLFVLTEYANEKNDTEVWPCQKTLRDRIGLDGKHAVRSVRRLLDRLEALNLIEVDSGQGKHRVSTYRLILRQANPASPCPPDKRTPESAYRG